MVWSAEIRLPPRWRPAVSNTGSTKDTPVVQVCSVKGLVVCVPPVTGMFSCNFFLVAEPVCVTLPPVCVTTDCESNVLGGRAFWFCDR